MRRALLDAGKTEFANYGYDGARLERIAAKAGCAKRMLYYYFGNKKDVPGGHRAELLDIRASEEQLNLDALAPCRRCMRWRKSFEYHEQNQEFTRLVLQENFQGGRCWARSPRPNCCARPHWSLWSAFCSAAWHKAVFRADVTAV
jgi:AcrR family transcriptional regulator